VTTVKYVYGGVAQKKVPVPKKVCFLNALWNKIFGSTTSSDDFNGDDGDFDISTELSITSDLIQASIEQPFTLVLPKGVVSIMIDTKMKVGKKIHQHTYEISQEGEQSAV
jgi:hypothetical protein